MLNFEYWKDTILEISTEKGGLSNNLFGLRNDEPEDCACIDCHECQFNTPGVACMFSIFKWLYSEHLDKPKLTKKERQFCELIETGWIVRNIAGRLTIMSDTSKRPYFDGVNWTCGGRYIDVMLLSTIDVTLDFDFIEPGENGIWNIKDLLSLEVED